MTHFNVAATPYDKHSDQWYEYHCEYELDLDSTSLLWMDSLKNANPLVELSGKW